MNVLFVNNDNMVNNLAIFGGNPVSANQLVRPSPIGRSEINAVARVLNSGVLSKAGRGKNVKIFEKKFAQFHNLKYAITTTSGTTALHTAICSLGIKQGDEILVPNLTFVSSASVVLQQNATPVFVDIDPITFCMITDDLESKITKRTKAIMVVHLYGHPAEMNKIIKIAKKYNLKIIEDCAQSHGAKYKGKRVGTFGDIACFSFYQTKNLTCGEGGMIITDNEKLYKVCASIVDHGLVNGNLQGYDYDRLGYNYHMTEIQAVVGIEQLKRLERMNTQRIINANKYKHILRGEGLIFQDDNKNINHVYYVLTALLPKKLKDKRDWFVDAVRAEGVEINKIYPKPLSESELFSSFNDGSLYPNTFDITMRLFNFYTNPGVTDHYIKKTCEAVKKVLNYLNSKVYE